MDVKKVLTAANRHQMTKGEKGPAASMWPESAAGDFIFYRVGCECEIHTLIQNH